MEDSLFAREVIGVPKPKESTTVSFFFLQFFKMNQVGVVWLWLFLACEPLHDSSLLKDEHNIMGYFLREHIHFLVSHIISLPKCALEIIFKCVEKQVFLIFQKTIFKWSYSVFPFVCKICNRRHLPFKNKYVVHIKKSC